MTFTAHPSNTEAFFFALLGTPAIAAIVLGIPLLIIFPIGLILLFAPFFGYIPFILLGGPLLYLSLRIFGNSPFTNVPAALIAVSMIGPLNRLGVPMSLEPGFAEYGYLMGSLWALVFGWVYGKLAGVPILDIPSLARSTPAAPKREP